MNLILASSDYQLRCLLVVISEKLENSSENVMAQIRTVGCSLRPIVFRSDPLYVRAKYSTRKIGSMQCHECLPACCSFLKSRYQDRLAKLQFVRNWQTTYNARGWRSMKNWHLLQQVIFMYFSTIPPIENAFEFECSVIVCVRSRLGTRCTSSILCYPRRHRVYFHCNAGFFYLTRMYCPYWENSSHFEWKLEDHSLCRTSVHAQSRDMQNTRMGYNFHKKSFFA